MKTISRTNALTAIAPLKPWLFWWCRILLPILRMVAMSPSLARLRFIHFGGWIVFRDLPGRRDSATLSPWRPRPSMVFMSDYDGDPKEYLAAFGLAVARGMRWSFGSAAGFPGPTPTHQFIDYVERHRVVELLRYSAYPDATVRDVDTALEVAHRIEHIYALRTGGTGDRLGAGNGDSSGSISFEVHYRALLRAIGVAPQPPLPSLLPRLWSALVSRSTVRGFAVVMPIGPDRTDDVTEAIGALANDPAVVFDPVGGVHFARLALLPVPCHLPPEDDDAPALRRPDHLLFSAWFDKGPDAFVDRLVAGLGPHADAIWSSCADYPGSDDPRRLASWIAAHRLRFSLFLGSRSGVPVKEIRDALALKEQVVDVLAATQGQTLAEIRRALGKIRGGGG